MSAPYLSDVFEDVSDEGQSAREKFGEQRDLDDLAWFAILGEEFGEVARHVTQASVPPITHPDRTPAMLRAELVQVAATAMRWCQVIDGRPATPVAGSTIPDRPLDVERLARAMALDAWFDYPEDERAGHAFRADGSLWPGDLEGAERLVATYARLAEAPVTGEEQ